MAMRGIRGAIQVAADTEAAIHEATLTLLQAILDANPTLVPEDLASTIFTLTDDLCATYPALAARRLPGWQGVPLLCGREIPVPTGLPRTLRVLIHWNTELPPDAVQHIYLGEAVRLRPDLDKGNGEKR